MANRGPSYGLSREVRQKITAKYDQELEIKQRRWISEVTGIEIPEEMSFQDMLKDGIILCSLIETIQQGSIKRPFPHTKLLNSFRCMENIQAFINAAESIGVHKASLFQTCDLYDGSNMTQVQTTIQSVASVAHSKGLAECDFAIKVSEKKQRNWDPKAGEAIIGLQMGSNKGATQRGMSFGTARPLYDQKYSGMGTQGDRKSSKNSTSTTDNITDNNINDHDF